MPKHLYVLVGFTFFIGIVSGVYVYFTSRAPSVVPEESSLEGARYEIVASMYGSCERIGCPSIRFLDDGSYTYLIERADGEYERFEGKLALPEYRRLNELMGETSFEELEQSTFNGTCPIIYDGAAYRFSILFEGTQYDLDSCANDLQGGVFETIESYFGTMSETYGSAQP